MFFTLEDERARIRGSRDPLGLLPVWGPLGRTVVSNLTTVSNSVRGFAVLLLGRYLGARLIASGRAKEEDALPMFLRFEQLAAYVRQCANEEGGSIRGIERVRKNLRTHGKKLPIGDDAACTILGDQKTYGLWGLFSVASRVSDLIPTGAVGVTARAQAFIELEYLPPLRKQQRALQKLILVGGRFSIQEKDPLYAALKRALPKQLTANERAFYGHYLRDGAEVTNVTAGIQAHAAKLLVQHQLLDEPLGREGMLALREAALASAHTELAQRLLRILDLEALIAPAGAMFQYLMTRSGQTVADVAQRFREQWGEQVPHLQPQRWEVIAKKVAKSTTLEQQTLMTQLHVALRAGDYAAAIRTLVKWNAVVMRRRNGAAWMELSGDVLEVKYRAEERPLVAGEQLSRLWTNSYFLESLRVVTKQLAAGRAQ